MASQLDFNIERAVRDHLAHTTPGIGFLGEEEGSVGPRRDAYWVLDPVDGTANLLRGIPLCAVSLALVTNDQPVVGVIDLPFLGSRYTATEDGGAYVNGAPIHASGVTDLAGAVISLGDYAVGTQADVKNRTRLAITKLVAGRAQRVRMFGSAAIDLAWLAEGRTDASIVLSNNPWDMAAGVVIAREAGAGVTDHDGTPYTFASRATVAAAPGVREAILNLVREAFHNTE